MLGLAIADHFTGPYRRLHPIPLFIKSNEDPFLWQDHRGHWHLLMHSLEEGGGYDGPMVGRHAYARTFDGEWTFGNRTLAFNTTTHFTDGSSIEYSRREMPQLYFSEDGQMTPLYLVTGVQETGKSSSYTLVQPLSTAAKWERENGYATVDEQENRHQRVQRME